MAQARRQEEIRKRQTDKRVQELAEAHRLKLLQKSILEEAEAEKRKALAAEMYEREKVLMDQKEFQERRNRITTKMKDEENRMKHEQHKLQLSQFFAQEQEQLRKRYP
jgi:hypothetical protein